MAKAKSYSSSEDGLLLPHKDHTTLQTEEQFQYTTKKFLSLQRPSNIANLLTLHHACYLIADTSSKGARMLAETAGGVDGSIHFNIISGLQAMMNAAVKYFCHSNNVRDGRPEFDPCTDCLDPFG